MTLDPTRRGFDWGNARACAEMCARAYTRTPWVYDRLTDAQGIMEDRDDCLVIAFRGSRSAKDWIQDGKFWLTTLNGPDGIGVKVHDGFNQDFNALNDDLVGGVRKMLPFDCADKPLSVKPIFVTGHSLGGALAILCALEFYRQGIAIAGVYLFGCPRVGDAAFRKLYDSALVEKTFSVVNQNDIVPRIPGLPATFLFPATWTYRRCGTRVFLPSDGGWSIEPSWWLMALSDAMGFWVAYRKRCDVLVSEHNIEAYQRRIQLLE